MMDDDFSIIESGEGGDDNCDDSPQYTEVSVLYTCGVAGSSQVKCQIETTELNNVEPDYLIAEFVLQLRIIGRDLVSFDVTRFGSFIKRIDLSFNYLKTLQGLSVCCETLEELVLDNNQLERLELGARFPRLDTISLNKNRVCDK